MTTTQLPEYGYATVLGNQVGASMGKDDFGKKFGAKSVVTGAKGEQAVFAQLKEWVQSDAVIFPSIQIPGGYSADIDFAIVRGNHILLVDAKNYAGGKTYTTKYGDKEPIIYENGSDTGRRASRSMDTSVSKLRKLLPGYVIDGIVVFAELGKPITCRELVWPGGYRSYYGREALPVVRGYLANGVGGHKKTLGAAHVMMALAQRNH